MLDLKDLGLTAFTEHPNAIEIVTRVGHLDLLRAINQLRNFLWGPHATLILKKLVQSHVEHLQREVFQEIIVFLQVRFDAKGHVALPFDLSVVWVEDHLHHDV